VLFGHFQGVCGGEEEQEELKVMVDEENVIVRGGSSVSRDILLLLERAEACDRGAWVVVDLDGLERRRWPHGPYVAGKGYSMLLMVVQVLGRLDFDDVQIRMKQSMMRKGSGLSVFVTGVLGVKVTFVGRAAYSLMG
jgi:hypothetical protein